MIVGFDATTLAGRISGVGYYTARLMESLANGAGDGRRRAAGRALQPRGAVPPAAQRLHVYRARRFRGALGVDAAPAAAASCASCGPTSSTSRTTWPRWRSRVPYVVSFHDMTPVAAARSCHTLKKRLLTSSLVPLVARGARLILAPSESTRRDVVRLLGVDPARVRVIPYAAAPAVPPSPRRARAAGRSATASAPPYFLYVGTLEPRKNLVRALRAFAAPGAPPARPALRAGGPARLEVRGRAARGGARRSWRGRVLFLGYVAEEDCPPSTPTRTAFVYPSLYEGFGLPVVEAMACGTPVLTSRCSSLAEIAARPPCWWTRATRRAGRRPAGPGHRRGPARPSVGDRGLARAREFSWERTGRETVAAYRAALEAPAASPNG